MRRFVLILLAVLACPAKAGAEGAGRVAVLPLVAGDADLRIYSRPVADAISRSLRERLAIDVETMSDASGAPANVDLVIDGRITLVSRGVIRLEARVRDPSVGRAIGSATAGSRPLEHIDRAAAELAGDLARVVRGWKQGRPREPYRLEEAVVEARSRRPASGGEPAPPEEPTLVILRAHGTAAGGSIPVARQATQATLAFAERLGVSFVTSNKSFSQLDSVTAANAVRSRGARYALTLEIHSVDFDFRGVLSARGRASIKLVDRNGLVVFGAPVSTDTVVGSRGDRHTALVYAVAEQALDIVAPRLRKALAR